MRKILPLLLALILAGCNAFGAVQLPSGWFGISTPTIPVLSTVTPSGREKTLQAPSGPTVTATPVPELTLWVPPEFDPAAGTPAGMLLAERLSEFSLENNGVQVNVRVKAASGASGLLDSLSAASSAAPMAMPSVIALPRGDLEVAALKGLLVSLDGASTTIDEPDWYDYARQLAMVQGTTFGLPFAGDALLVVYRPARVVGPPTDWEAVYRLGQPLAFPAGDSQGLFVLSLYQSIDGVVEDAQRRPTLETNGLSQVLQVISDGKERGIFPSWLTQYETNAQAWQAYHDLRVNALVTWASSYLTAEVDDSSAVAVPSMDDTPQTLATGWVWAVSDPLPERRALSIRLAEFLTDGEFMARWTEAAGFLPTRPSAMAAWTNQNFKTLLSPVAVTAKARPSVEILSILGPVLKEATVKVLEGQSDPTQAAQAAAERLAVPESH